MELWIFLNGEDNGTKWWLHFSINSWWKTELKKRHRYPIFTATLFMIGRTWMQTRKKSVGWWTDKGVAAHVPYGVLLFSCLVPQSFSTPYNPIDSSTSGFPVHHHLPEFVQLMSIESVMPSNHLILCHSFFCLPSIFLSIRVFSNKLDLCIRKPKYWSLSFSISPSNEYSGLISFRIDWFDLLAVQGTLKSLQHHSSEASILQCSAFLIVPTLTSIHDYWKNHSFD